MPNIFVQRYFILGQKNIVDNVFKKFFFKQGKQWKSHGLMETDPLEEQIVDSGEFIHQSDHISFSSYMGWDMHPELIKQMAKKLPRGTILLVIGYDMDDYPSKNGGQILEIEGETGNIITNKTYPSQWISKHHFPLLYEKDND